MANASNETIETINIDERCPEISPECLQSQIDDFYVSLGEFLDIAEYPNDLEYEVNDFVLIEILIRIDKRRIYYQYFHAGQDISERKQVALLAYWLVKLRPIYITDIRDNSIKFQSSINEAFACYAIEATLMDLDPTFSIQKVESKKCEYSFFDRMLYNFRYQNPTIESIMMTVEAMSPDIYSLDYQSEYWLA